MIDFDKVATVLAEDAHDAADLAREIAERALVRTMTPGPKGDQGIPGETIKGDIGPVGPKGDSIIGERGLTGDIGTDGKDGKDGERGERGPTGRAGKAGRDGINGSNGKDGLPIVWRGPWDVNTDYQINDAVEYEGSSYIAIAETLGARPGTDVWDLMSARGVDGRDGLQSALSFPGIGGGSSGGSGTVTSVALTMPTAVFDVVGSPITGAGTLAVTLDAQLANTAFLGPASGAAATPAFRALVAADVPALTASVLTLGATSEFTNERTATAGQGITITDAGPGSTATITSTGFYTNGFLLKRTASHLVTPSSISDGGGIHAYYMEYISQQDKCYFTTGNIAGGGTVGRLCYMDRVMDTPVVLASYTPTVKKPGAFGYDPVSTRLYINNLAVGAVFSASSSTGAVITYPIAINGACGIIRRPTDGKFYCIATGSLFSLDPTTDTVSSSLGSVSGSPITGSERSFCYADSCDSLFIIMTNGSFQRYKFAATAGWQTAFTGFSSAASGGSVVHDAVTNCVYGVSVNDTAGLKIINLASPDVVASTIPYPLGFTEQTASCSGEMILFGRYLLLGTHTATIGTVLIFDLTSQTFISALLGTPSAALAGRFLGGVATEGVLYVGSGNAGAGQASYLVYGR